mmetsp:Transcript_82120/g.266000  ORF Transcript_82120/g.266000 Transcript_82120/m.266000 type:complete len:118 (-) Transcript_82120:1904-2257(-)
MPELQQEYWRHRSSSSQYNAEHCQESPLHCSTLAVSHSLCKPDKLLDVLAGCWIFLRQQLATWLLVEQCSRSCPPRCGSPFLHVILAAVVVSVRRGTRPASYFPSSAHPFRQPPALA